MVPYEDFAIIGAVAAAVTFVATFVVRRLAIRFSFIVVPDARRVHKQPTPTVGGAAMFIGFLAAIGVASRLPEFSGVFRGNSEPLGLVLGAAVIFFVGMTDDLRDMSPPAKMSGQILAGTVLYLFGVTMFYVRLPLVGTTLLLSPQLAPVFTVLWVVGIANAINLIDGLDGLAAGIVAIASIAFFIYSHELLSGTGPIINSGPVIAVIVFGLCVGFLPHNFHPARIFMGDAGAMLLGLLMAGSTMSVVGQTSETTAGRTFFTFAPIIIPFFILGIPLADATFAFIRRARRGMNPAVADKNHLHHRLLRLGHGQRGAVLILWTWTALLSTVVLYPSLTDYKRYLLPVVVVVLAVLLVAMFARGRRRAEGDAASSMPPTATLLPSTLPAAPPPASAPAPASALPPAPASAPASALPPAPASAPAQAPEDAAEGDAAREPDRRPRPDGEVVAHPRLADRLAADPRLAERLAASRAGNPGVARRIADLIAPRTPALTPPQNGSQGVLASTADGARKRRSGGPATDARD